MSLKQIMGKPSGEATEEKWYEYKIPWPEMNYEIPTAFSMPIRNYKTILRANGDAIQHCDCGHILSQKLVSFSIWCKEMSGGFGQVVSRPVLWCPKCDPEPPESGIMRLPTPLALALSEARR